MTPELAAYLTRLGLPGDPHVDLPPTLDTLVAVHRAHLDAVPYESLSTMLGRPPSVRPEDCLARIGEVGRAGYCFHQNAALELVLRELGFSVTRRRGEARHALDEPLSGELDHLVVVVDGLPTAANPGGRWWPDVGLGDGFRDPLPLAGGRYRQGPFCYRMVEVSGAGWSFEHDPAASVAAIEVTSGRVDQAAVDRSHARLTTAPDGRFTHLVVVERRTDEGADLVRGCVWTHVDAAGKHPVDLTTYEQWREVVTGRLGLSLDGIGERELRELYAGQWARHRQWTAEGRP